MTCVYKNCSACKRNLSGSMFSPDKRVPSGLASRCKTCQAEAVKQRRALNPAANRDAVKRSTEKHYAEKLARNRAYRAKNSHKVSQWKKSDRKNNKARVLADNALRRARIRSVLTVEIKQIYALRDFMSAMSLGDLFHVDHIIPLAAGGKHEAANLQILPARCNLLKGSKTQVVQQCV